MLATLFVKGKNEALAESWEQVAMAATARAEEATRHAVSMKAENDTLRLRVEHLEHQVQVLVDTVTAKDFIDALSRDIDRRFTDLTAFMVEASTTAGAPRAPGRRGGAHDQAARAPDARGADGPRERHHR